MRMARTVLNTVVRSIELRTANVPVKLPYVLYESDVTVTEGSSLIFWSSWPMTETVEN